MGAIEESSTYQELMQKGEARGEARGLERGAIEEARKLVLKLGRKRFGVPSSQVRTTVKRTIDVLELERFCDRLLDVNSWEELLGLPVARRKKGGE